MKDKKTIEYDYGGGISYTSGLMNVSALMAGFTFTGIIVVLTNLGDSSALFSQIALAILVVTLGFLFNTLWELQYITTLICIHSTKPMIFRDLARWRTIQMALWLSGFLLMISIPVMFLLKNLTILFIFSLGFLVLGSIRNYFYRWKPVEKELDDYHAREPRSNTY